MGVCGHIALTFNPSDIDLVKKNLASLENMDWVKEEISFNLVGEDYQDIDLILKSFIKNNEYFSPLSHIVNGENEIEEGPRSPWYVFYRDDIISIKNAFDKLSDQVIYEAIDLNKEFLLYESMYHNIYFEKIVIIKEKYNYIYDNKVEFVSLIF